MQDVQVPLNLLEVDSDNDRVDGYTGIFYYIDTPRYYIFV